METSKGSLSLDIITVINQNAYDTFKKFLSKTIPCFNMHHYFLASFL